MAGGVETRTLSKSITEQLRLSDVEELNYILKDNFEGKFYIISIITNLFL